MNIMIAKNREDCESWTGTAVVIDVLRSSTTICALLQRGKKNLRLYDDKQQAVAYKQAYPNTEFFSELEFEEKFERADNSPFLAMKSAADKPGVIITTAGTPAVMSLKNANKILMGGFCNFFAVISYLKIANEDVLIVPSALFGYLDNIEDFLCAEEMVNYLRNMGDVDDALKEIKNTKRFADFLKERPATGKKDAELCLKLNSIPVVPYIKIFGSFARVYRADALPKSFDEFEVTMPLPKEEPAQKNALPDNTEIRELKADIFAAPAKEETSVKIDPASEEESGKSIIERLLGGKIKGSLEKENTASTKTIETKTAPALEPVPAPAFEPAHAPTEPPKIKKLNKKAIVLFSGGMDSAVCLYWALSEGYDCTALSISYGQKHKKEVDAAEKIAGLLRVPFTHISLNLPWLNTSSLVGAGEVPRTDLKNIGKEIPSTYVPARNLMFVSIAASLADSMGAHAIVLGPNAVDFSAYPDCKPEFYKPLGSAIKEGTKYKPEILTPIIKMSKAEIIKLGQKLNVPFEKTWTCYNGADVPCGECESCRLRAKGFKDAGLEDPALK